MKYKVSNQIVFSQNFPYTNDSDPLCAVKCFLSSLPPSPSLPCSVIHQGWLLSGPYNMMYDDDDDYIGFDIDIEIDIDMQYL